MASVRCRSPRARLSARPTASAEPSRSGSSSASTASARCTRRTATEIRNETGTANAARFEAQLTTSEMFVLVMASMASAAANAANAAAAMPTGISSRRSGRLARAIRASISATNRTRSMASTPWVRLKIQLVSVLLCVRVGHQTGPVSPLQRGSQVTFDARVSRGTTTKAARTSQT